MIILFASPDAWPLHGVAEELAGLCDTQARVGDLEGLRPQLVEAKPAAIFFGGYDWTEAECAVLAQIGADLPGCALAVYTPAPSPNQIIALMRSGVREVVTQDTPEGIADAFTRLMPQLKSAGPATAAGPKRIGFISAKGGDGATTAVVNYAAALAASGQRCVLADLALPYGDCDLQLLDAPAENGLAAFVKEVDRLDPRLISAMLTKPVDNLGFIPAPADPESLGDITPPELQKLVEKLSVMPGQLLLDLGTATHAGALGLLDGLDQIYLVVRPEVASMRRAGQLLMLFRALEVDLQRVAVVLNRATSRSLVGAADLATATGVSVAVELPHSDEVARAGTHYSGAIVTARPKDRFSQAIRQWVGGGTATTEKKGSVWRRLKAS
ncbi:MAG: CpaE family protein [Chakrabartia sp.]